MNVLDSIDPTRSCGPCTACCRTFYIRDLGKKHDEPCKHLSPAGGCGIHDQPRPELCVNFVCAYLLKDSPIRIGERPDEVGVVIAGSEESQFSRETGLRPYSAFELWPGAFASYRADKMLKRFAKRALVGLVARDAPRDENGRVPSGFLKFIGPPAQAAVAEHYRDHVGRLSAIMKNARKKVGR